MKVVVYGICKDESQFVDRWMDSMEEADQVVVLDTGSQDDTVEKLRRRGAVVEQEIIQPWRFDTARNRSMALSPPTADVCVCTDLDEAFHPGWRAALERAWTPDATQGPLPLYLVLPARRAGGRGVLSGENPPQRRLSLGRTGSRGAQVSGLPAGKDHHPAGCAVGSPADPQKSGANTCPCWNWRWRRNRKTTAAPTTWGGNTCFTACGANPSPSSSGI